MADEAPTDPEAESPTEDEPLEAEDASIDGVLPPIATFDGAMTVEALAEAAIEPPGPDATAEAFIVEAYDEALQERRVTLAMIADATFRAREANPDAIERTTYLKYAYPLYEMFLEQHGEETRVATCQNRPCAAASIGADFDVIYSVGQPGLLEIDKLIFNTGRLSERAKSYLETEELKTCINMLFDVLSASLVVADGVGEASGAPAPSPESILFLNQELARGESYLHQAAQRRAQFRYFRGVLIGAGFLYGIALLGVLGLFAAPEVGQAHPSFATLIGCVLAGCTGAVVSVMTRMTRGSLVLDYTMGKLLWPIGLFRPLVGAIFGVAAFILLSGGLIGLIDVPQDPTTELYFFLGLAFLAGFSERFAQDMLSTTEAELLKTAGVSTPPPAVPPPTATP